MLNVLAIFPNQFTVIGDINFLLKLPVILQNISIIFHFFSYIIGIKSTLQKLLKAKEESNEMAAQRLALERERLQFERTIAEKFLGIFEQNQKFQQQLIQQQMQQNHHHQSQQRPTTTQQIFTTTTGNPATATAIQNQGQIMIPPKLLITTMVPTSVATSSAGSANTKVITTANIKNVTNTLTVEQPLLIPKEEPLD